MILELIIDAVAKGFIAKLIAAVPFFGLPGISWVLTLVVTKVASALGEELWKLGWEIRVDFKTESEKKAYDESVMALQKATEGGNSDEIQKAKEDFQNRLKHLIKLKS